MNPNLRVGDLIEVPSVQTIIRLEEGRTHSESIARSFVFTPEVTSHFSILAESLLKDRGRGFFLQGDFGSGKSHFLAAFTAWLSNSPGSEVLSAHHEGIRRVKASGRKFLAVDISLVKYRSTTSLERILVEAVETALASRGVETGLTPLAAFLNYFKTLLEDDTLAFDFAKQVGISPDKTGRIHIYLRAHPRQAYAEGIRFMKRIGIKTPEALVEERHETFTRVIHAVKDADFDGLVFIIDELSEFFRSKPDARTLNEDARTLQLCGELAGSEPVWIIAAVQESIERTGDIAQVTFRKIKDRFPVKLILSTIHIKALIANRLVKIKPGADREIHNLYEYFSRQFRSFTWSFEDFRATYPVHPMTIALLDGLGDLFSEHRGIVDFVHYRIAGDASRQISGILDRPAHELLGPDSIYEHFYQKMAEFSALHVYPRHVIPHLDDIIRNTIDEPEDRILAQRIVRVLVLYKIHPTASSPMVKELTELVACALSEQDPDLNVQFVAEAILDPLVEKSKFLVKHVSETEDPLEAVYTVVTEEDPGKTFRKRISRAASEIPPDDTRLLTLPFAELAESASWPGPGLWKHEMNRFFTWRHSSRRVFVALLNSGEEALLKDRITKSLSGGDTDFAVVISFGKTDFQLEHTAVWEITLPLDEKNTSILRAYLAAKQMTSMLQSSNPADAPLFQISQEALQSQRPAVYQAALSTFYSGNFTDPRITIDPVIRQMKRFDRLLDPAGEFLLEERYPLFAEVAPRKTAPSPRLYQRLIDEFISPGSLSIREAHSRGLSDAIDGLAAPLGLVELRSGSYIFSPDIENHPLLTTVFGMMNTACPTRLADLLLSLRTNKFGLPADTVFFLLSALAHGGLITILKNGRALPLEMIRATTVENADALAPGEVIGKHDRETLVNECRFLSPDVGWESFGLRQQRDVWQAVIKFRDWVQRTVSDVGKRLSSFAEFSAFEGFSLGSLRSLLSRLQTLSEEIRISFPAREGIERFLQAWRRTGATPQDIDILKRMRTFFAQHAEQFVFVNHYMRHKAVDHAASEDKGLAGLKDEVMVWLDHPDSLLMEEDTSRLVKAFDRFRTGYGEYYNRKHAKHYERFVNKPLSKFAKRALALLQRLASVDVLDRPPGLENLFRGLERPGDAVCRRNLSEELMRSPVCSCGFMPGESSEPKTIKNPEETIEQCLEEYLLILKNSRVREAVSARVFALTDADPEMAKRLRNFNSFLEDAHGSSTGLLDLLDDITAGEISKSLSGRVLIEKRGIKDLISGLEGRRLSPKQIFERVREWVSIKDENTVIAIDHDLETPVGDRIAAVSWWATMHPMLFKADASLEIRGIESALERQFPAGTLRKAFAKLDDKTLADFLKGEPFHTQAIRMAWLLFTQRILAGRSWPEKTQIGFRHVDPEIAGRLKGQLRILKRIALHWHAPFPDALRIRIPLSEILVDTWATMELQLLVHEKIQKVMQIGEEWLSTLPPVEPIILSDNPIIVIFDGISPDVWLDTMDQLACDVSGLSLAWFRLEGPPKTAPAISELFGFSHDALDEFSSRNISCHQLKGNELHGMKELLPAFPPDQPVVIRISMVDAGAHAAILRLSEMSGTVSEFLESELPRLIRISSDQKRRLVVTTDHGLSITRTGMSHGKGGVFERAIFRVEWGRANSIM